MGVGVCVRVCKSVSVRWCVSLSAYAFMRVLMWMYVCVCVWECVFVKVEQWQCNLRPSRIVSGSEALKRITCLSSQPNRLERQSCRPTVADDELLMTITLVHTILCSEAQASFGQFWSLQPSERYVHIIWYDMNYGQVSLLLCVLCARSVCICLWYSQLNMFCLWICRGIVSARLRLTSSLAM